MCCKPEHISTGFTEPCRADTSTCENTLKKFVMFKNKIFKQERVFFFFFLFCFNSNCPALRCGFYPSSPHPFPFGTLLPKML